MTTIGADETIIQEITIKAPARRIFEALTNPEQRNANSGRSRPRFRNDAARHSEIIPPTVPR